MGLPSWASPSLGLTSTTSTDWGDGGAQPAVRPHLSASAPAGTLLCTPAAVTEAVPAARSLLPTMAGALGSTLLTTPVPWLAQAQSPHPREPLCRLKDPDTPQTGRRGEDPRAQVQVGISGDRSQLNTFLACGFGCVEAQLILSHLPLLQPKLGSEVSSCAPGRGVAGETTPPRAIQDTQMLISWPRPAHTRGPLWGRGGAV